MSSLPTVRTAHKRQPGFGQSPSAQTASPEPQSRSSWSAWAPNPRRQARYTPPIGAIDGATARVSAPARRSFRNRVAILFSRGQANVSEGGLDGHGATGNGGFERRGVTAAPTRQLDRFVEQVIGPRRGSTLGLKE